jgi:hypothetical protein
MATQVLGPPVGGLIVARAGVAVAFALRALGLLAAALVVLCSGGFKLAVAAATPGGSAAPTAAAADAAPAAIADAAPASAAAGMISPGR